MQKLVLIGCGRISPNHIEAICKNEDKIKLEAICDLNRKKVIETLKLLKNKGINNIKMYLDYKEMLKEVECDSVSIATDSGSHAEIAIYCMNKGKNVLVEKPMALSIKDAEEMIKVSKSKNVYLGVCFQNRYNEAIKLLRKAIEEGRFGRIANITSLVLWNRNDEYYKLDKWRGTWKHDGGCLMNQSIHSVDMLQWMSNSNCHSVYGKISNAFHDTIEVEDFGSAILNFDNSITGLLEGTVCVYPDNYKETISIIGENGFVEVGGVSLNKIECWKFKDKKEYDNYIKDIITNEEKGVYGIGHIKLYSEFFDSINKGEKFLIDGEEGIKSLKIILGIYKSSVGKDVIELKNLKFSTREMEMEDLKNGK